MSKPKIRKILKKTWHFIWEDNSIWSWIVNIALAFVLIKFVVYPGLGLVLGTNYPVVAVVSGSMEHNGMGFDEWWSANNAWYRDNKISKEEFSQFPLQNGFNKGDIMILVGREAEEIEIGDVIVFRSARKDPIIHRVVKKTGDGQTVFQTKGDNNAESIRSQQLDETRITEDHLIGKTVFRVPFLGYIKIGFVKILGIFGL